MTCLQYMAFPQREASRIAVASDGRASRPKEKGGEVAPRFRSCDPRTYISTQPVLGPSA